MEVRFLTAGDRAVSVEFGKTICLETNAKVRMLDENLKEDPIEGMIETVLHTVHSSFTTVRK